MAITSKFVFNPFTGNFDSTIDANLSYAQVKYVDKANTFTYTADGSIDKPYKSIEDMYNAITDASASKRYAVVIAPGTYTEAATIRIKGWIDLVSFATDTVIIAVAGGATLKWSNNNPGRVFIKDMGFTSGFEILNDNPTGTSGIVFDLDNVDAPSIIFNGRGGGRDFIQLRNDTRISGSCTIRSAATTIFDSTNISNLIMSDVGCVAPDAFGSAITASLRSNYIGAIQITATTFDVYTDIWGTIVAGNLSITSNSPSFPCYFNHDATSYPLGTITLTGSNPAQVVATSVAQAIRYTPATPANWPTVPDDVKEGLDLLSASIVGNQQLTKEPTGFASRTTSTISFDELNREFTIAPTGASFEVYVKGAKFTKTSESITIPNNSGDHYIYYSSTGVLSSTMVLNESLFADNALVAIIYWNADTSKQSYFGEERHGLVMDGATHGYLHTVFGARYISGCALQGFTIGAGSVDADAQFSADSGSIRDEDILHQFSSQAQLPVLYRSGDNWRKKPADAFPFIQSGVEGYVGASGRIAFNEFTGGAWQLTEVPNNHFTMVHVFATNDINTPYVAIIGTNTYATKPDAQDSANSEIASLTGIPFAEFVAIGTVILQSADSFTNSVKAAVQVTGDGADYVDFRGAQIFSPSGQASNHSLLSNLDKDDHIQYYNEARGDARYVRNGVSLGSGEDVFAQKNTTNLEFKSLVAGTNVTMSSDANEVTINCTAASIPGYFTGFSLNTFSGDASQTSFTLSQTPDSVDHTDVFIGGVYQQKSTYSLAGATLTFSEAPPTGTNNIEVKIFEVNAVADYNYTPSVLSDWVLPLPTNVAEGLDSLAANKAGTVSDVGTGAGGQTLINLSSSTDVRIKGLKAGTGITITNDVGSNNLVVEATASGSAITVKDDGTVLTTSATSFDFIGAGVTAADLGSGNITVTIPGSAYADVAVPALDIDWSAGDLFYMDLTTSSTLTFSNIVQGKTISVAIRNTSASDILITLPTTIKSPLFDAVVRASNKETVFTFMAMNSKVYAASIGDMN